LSDQTLSLGKINEQLGFNVSAEYLKTLGFTPVAKDKRAMLYTYEQYKDICQRIAGEMAILAKTGVRDVTPRVVQKRVPKGEKPTGATTTGDVLDDPDDMSGGAVAGVPDPDDDEL
jgi:hypothetical protein